MSQVHIECPICMDNVELNKNSVTTECGHCFHTSCLMKNVAHNGFGCPYCRTEMAEEVEDDDDSSSDWSIESEEEEELYDDSALRGLRLFTDNIEGIEHAEEDVEDEEEEAEELRARNTRQQEEVQNQTVIKPSPSFIAEKLVQQGVTMEQLVKALLINHREYEAEEEEFVRLDDDLFGRFRIIISNYETQQTVNLQEEEIQTINHPNVTLRRPMRA